MKINLAGFNVDVENINKLNEILNKDNINNDDIDILKNLNWTPETISASYARISRDPRPINELRQIASKEIDKTRKSNKSIIFEMGHSSIAEHGIFNIDIIDISRLLAEELEKSRLVSFTEKSQRYIKIGSDYLIPDEFKDDSDFTLKYKNLINDLFNTYNKLHDSILPYFLDQNPGIDVKSSEYRDIINLAKEDARYILPLSTLTQTGMTLNSRNLERIIRKLKSNPLSESKELGNNLFSVIKEHAPSLVKYTEATDYDAKTYPSIKKIIESYQTTSNNTKEVELVNNINDTEDNILASLLLKVSSMDFNSANTIVKKWDIETRKKVFFESIKYLNSYDPVLREFEMSDFVFNIVISATAYAQLKRHRMATIIDGEYNPSLGIIIPESIKQTGQEDIFLESIYKIENLHKEAKNNWYYASNYILSNSHRKNILLKCNFRELVHISRLRSDKHAQWDIRNLSDKITSIIKDKLPIIGNFLAGKDNFDEIIKKI